MRGTTSTSLSLDGMVDRVAEGGPFCAVCFSGEYSAPLVDLEG